MATTTFHDLYVDPVSAKVSIMVEATYLDSTRASYDTVAVDYAELSRDSLAESPMDRAMLGIFAELVDPSLGPVADIGCGPGRITAHLRGLGCDVFGIDLSPGMVDVARRTYPELRFDVGSMTALELADGALGGVVAWYSVIHTPTELLPAVFAEFGRVLAPGGRLLLAFQVGDELVHLSEAYGHPVSIDAYRRSPELVSELLADAGLPVHAALTRAPEGREKTHQSYLLATRSVRPDS